jgi:hypothetical protein
MGGFRMSPEIITLLLQTPLVGIFVFFVIYTRSEDRKERAENRKVRAENDERWRNFLREQREGFEKVINYNTESLKLVVEKVEIHDRSVNEAIAVMKDRTKRDKES